MLIEKYNPKWANWFSELKAIYISKLGNLVSEVHHVGSTSVPGLPAKPIIDIDIEIKDYNLFPDVIEKLGELGYIQEGDLGIKNREAFRAKDESVPYNIKIKKWITHHLYVCPEFSQELKRHIIFRNHLICNEDARKQYSELKNKIAMKANNDIKRYAEIKEIEAKEFIENIIKMELRGRS